MNLKYFLISKIALVLNLMRIILKIEDKPKNEQSLTLTLDAITTTGESQHPWVNGEASIEERSLQFPHSRMLGLSSEDRHD